MSIRTRIALHKLASGVVRNPLYKVAGPLDAVADWGQRKLDAAGRWWANSDAAEYRAKNNMNKMMRDRAKRDAGEKPTSWDRTIDRNNFYANAGEVPLVGDIIQGAMRAVDRYAGRGEADAATAEKAIANRAKREGAMNQQIREQQAEIERLRSGQAQSTGGLNRAIQTAQGARAIYNRVAPNVKNALRMMPRPTTAPPQATEAPEIPEAPAVPEVTGVPAAASAYAYPAASAAGNAVNAAAQGVGQTYDTAVDTVTDAARGVGDTVQTAASIPGSVVGGTLGALGLNRTGQVAQRALNVPGEIAGNTIRGVSDFAGNIARGDFRRGFVNAGNQIGRDVSNLFTGWWN